MKKKIVSIAIVLCLAVTAIAGATLAYFTDTDKDINVMVSGNVEIVQNETDRYGDPYALYDANDFENNYESLSLYPAVYLKKVELEDGKTAMMPYNGNVPAYDETMENTNTNTKFEENAPSELNIWDEVINNEIDKVISVTNKGSSDVFVRTIVLMENTEDNYVASKIHGLWCNDDGQYRVWVTNDNGGEVMVSIDGTLYSVAVCTYETPLAAGATTSPSLMQIFLDPTAGNEWSEQLEDDQFKILALSQAVQIVGFEEFGAEVALNTAFGEVTADNVYEWFTTTAIKTSGAYNVIGGELNEQ